MNIPLRALFLPLLILSVAAPSQAQARTKTVAENSFQTTLVALTNKDRAAQGAPTVTPNALLAAAAQKKANDMAAKSYFAHYSPRGTSPWHWFTSVGYFYSHAGENLALNFETPNELETAWMASPGHRANIVKGLYTQMGVGVAHGMYEGKPATFTVELFATPANTQNPAS